jgi:hypothetical protein
VKGTAGVSLQEDDRDAPVGEEESRREADKAAAYDED